MIEFKRQLPANVGNPDTGYDVLFLDDNGVYYTKDSAGVSTVLGNGIASIAKVGTSGLVDTYRITFDSGDTFDYTVTNGDDGRSIVSIDRTAGNGAAGTVDTYTITYTKAPLTTTFQVRNGANGTGTPANAAPPAVAATSSTGTQTAEYALEDHTHAGVTSFNGRQGVVTPQQADYDAFFTTPAEAAAASPVQSFNGRTGSITPQQADYDQFFTTTAEAAAAAPVQNFNGRTGNITPQQADYDAFFTTPAEAAAAAPVQSVNGQTGNVTVAAGTNNAAVTRTAPTASASTALTTIQSYPVAAGEITAGSEYEFYASLRVINTTTATNAVITISVGATNVLVLTQALGTTAAAAPGAAVTLRGRITFSSATQAECEVHAFKQAAVAFTALANTSAPITVSAAGATTIDLKFNTSGATSTFIARQATIHRVK